MRGGTKCQEETEQAPPGEAGQEAAEEKDRDDGAAQVQEEWEAQDPGPARAATVSAPSADSESRIARACHVLTSAARNVTWQWCAKARPITRKSKAVAPSVSRRAERRV